MLRQKWMLQQPSIVLSCSACRRSICLISVHWWLRKHGPRLQLRKLRMHSVIQHGLSVLSCQLQHLSLHRCGFDFSDGGSTFYSSISTATALRSLHFSKCRLISANPQRLLRRQQQDSSCQR
jgi:hypothetical protein